MIAADESRNEVDELAQFLASWQRVTIERLSGRVEVSEALDVGILAHVARLIGAERIIVNLVEPDGLHVVDGYPAITAIPLVGDSPGQRAVDTGEIFMGDLQEEGWGESVVAWRYTVDTGPVMAIPMVSGARPSVRSRSRAPRVRLRSPRSSGTCPHPRPTAGRRSPDQQPL